MIEYNVIVLAAGIGKRMNADGNKQFILIKDKPLIIHTIAIFDHDEWCKSIILVVNPKERQKMEQLIKQYAISTPITLVDGGAERQDSVYRGLSAIKTSNELVFIHDGARPFVQKSNLHQLARVVKEKRAALLAVPVTDTIKQLNQGVVSTLDRQTLWAAQTPQAFHMDVIHQAHQSAVKEQFLGTDDASLVERLGIPIEIVRGSYDNIKLTTQEDLHHARAHVEKL